MRNKRKNPETRLADQGCAEAIILAGYVSDDPGEKNVFFVPATFSGEVLSLVDELHVGLQWLTRPSVDEPDRLVRFGIRVATTVKGGAMRGFLRRCPDLGASIALYKSNSDECWQLVSLKERALPSLLDVGDFAPDRLDTLTSILIQQSSVLDVNSGTQKLIKANANGEIRVVNRITFFSRWWGKPLL
jgi:hypothetical protein